MHLRFNLLGQPRKAVRPLNEAAAIESGANTLAEGFLFSVAAALVIGESWRSSRNTNRRRVSVDDQLDELAQKVDELRLDLHSVVNVWEERWENERKRSEDLTRIVETLVNLGLKDGLGDFGSVQFSRSSSSSKLPSTSSHISGRTQGSNTNSNQESNTLANDVD